MSTFMNKALAYLGLKDLEDEEYYDDEYDNYEEEQAPPIAPPLVGRTAYPRRDVEEPQDGRGIGGTIRPLQSQLPPEEPPTRQALLRPLAQSARSATAKVHIVAPEQFAEAQEIGDMIKQGNPVIVNLQLSDRDLARRMIDFCSGVTYALAGSMEKVAEDVFLLTPSNVDVSPEDRVRLQARGLFQQ